MCSFVPRPRWAPARGRGLANSRQGLRVSASSGQNPSNTNLKQTSTLKTDPAIRKDWGYIIVYFSFGVKYLTNDLNAELNIDYIADIYDGNSARYTSKACFI